MLTLYFHPFSSFCQKALIALYEAGAAFDPVTLDLGDPAQRDMLRGLWPMGRFPVLRDGGSGEAIAESTIIIEWLAQRAPGATALVPGAPEDALRVRFWDRVFDHDVHHPMQKIVLDRLRPKEARDRFGVEEARGKLRTAYAYLDAQAPADGWWTGGDFTMADCAAAPALRYAGMVEPFQAAHPRLAAYVGRLLERPSFARVLDEALPYADFFPKET